MSLGRTSLSPLTSSVPFTLIPSLKMKTPFKSSSFKSFANCSPALRFDGKSSKLTLVSLIFDELNWVIEIERLSS